MKTNTIQLFHLRPWSYSKLRRVTTCEFAFFWQYVLNVKPPRSEALVIGSGIHYILEKALDESLLKGSFVGERRLKEFLSEFCEREKIKEEKLLKFIPNISRFVKAHIRKLDKESFEVIGTEKQFVVDEYFEPLKEFNDKRAFIRGKLDFILFKNGTVKVVDHKTSIGISNVERAFTQLKIYAVLAMESLPPARSFILELHNVKKGEVSRRIYDIEQLVAFREKLRRKILSIEEALKGKGPLSLKPATSKSVCEYCDFKNICCYAVRNHGKV